MALEVDFLMGVEEEERFLSQIVGRELLLERIVLKMEGGRNLGDQIRIRKGRVFLRLDLFGGVRKKLLLILMIK